MAAGTRGLSDAKSTFVRSISGGVGFGDDGLELSAEAARLEGPFLAGVEGAGEAAAGVTGVGMTPGICFSFSRSVWLMLMSSLEEVSNRIREMSWKYKTLF